MIYTDGSCVPQADVVNRRAGMGVSFGVGHEWNISEPLAGEKQTSARAELVAVIRALETRDRHAPTRNVMIHCDCNYAILEVNRILWPKRYKQIKGERLNGDMIDKLAKLLLLRKAEVQMIKVTGHSGDPGNDDAHDLAKAAADKAFEKWNREKKQSV